MAEQNDDGQESGTVITLEEEHPVAASSEALRRDIETTRAAIDEKLGALQDKVRTVQTKAKQVFDLRYQIEQHPWAALGAAVAAGFVAGSLGTAEAEEYRPPVSAALDAAGAAQHPRPRLRTPRRDLFGTLKLAMGAALMELARQAIRNNMPIIGMQLDKVWEGRGLTSVSAASALLGPDRSASPE